MDAKYKISIDASQMVMRGAEDTLKLALDCCTSLDAPYVVGFSHLFELFVVEADDIHGHSCLRYRDVSFYDSLDFHASSSIGLSKEFIDKYTIPSEMDTYRNIDFDILMESPPMGLTIIKL